MLLIFIAAVLIAVLCSIVPVIAQAIRLKARAAALADNQLFVALSASQTSAENLPRSLAALEAQAQALQLALQHVRESFSLWTQLPVISELRDLKKSSRTLIDVLR